MLWWGNLFQTYRIKKNLMRCLFSLAQLQKNYFNAYLKSDFLEHKYNYAKDLQLRQRKVLQALQRSRANIKNHPRYLLVLNKIEHLYEILCALHLLRYRIIDYALFEICHREFSVLSDACFILLNDLSKSLKKSMTIDVEPCRSALHRFEILYTNTLQVVAQDPLMFVFFVKNMHSFLEEVMELNLEIRLSNEKIY